TPAPSPQRPQPVPRRRRDDGRAEHAVGKRPGRERDRGDARRTRRRELTNVKRKKVKGKSEEAEVVPYYFSLFTFAFFLPASARGTCDGRDYREIGERAPRKDGARDDGVQKGAAGNRRRHGEGDRVLPQEGSQSV